MGDLKKLIFREFWGNNKNLISQIFIKMYTNVDVYLVMIQIALFMSVLVKGELFLINRSIHLCDTL